MTMFNINGDNGAWFDMEDGVRVQLRLVTAHDLRAIRQQTVKKKVEYKRVEGKAERFEYEEVDSEKQNLLFWDRTILAWEKVCRDGEPLPCTAENKIVALEESRKFQAFVSDALRTLDAVEMGRAEALEKN